MMLKNFVIYPTLSAHKTITIVAADGPMVIVAYLRQEELASALPHLQLTDQERVHFAVDNLAALQRIISDKYERGEWHSGYRPRARCIEVDRIDLIKGPPLTQTFGPPAPEKLSDMARNCEQTRDRYQRLIDKLVKMKPCTPMLTAALRQELGDLNSLIASHSRGT
ncbi:MAG TPA: hypothetical protein VM689_25555 [Aliidongia sp.]|nr:hypothetical protein [Aliidongia sp.]